MNNRPMPRERPTKKRWVPAPGWPEPPEGWSPPWGWQPPPSWPPAPPGHKFWRRTAYGRRRHRIWLAVGATLAVLLPGGCLAGTVAYGPCFFDPPPGDVFGLQVRNDTGQVAVVADCWDDSCRSAGPGLAVAVGRSVNYQIEACTGGTLAVLDPTTRTIRACLIEPTERDDGSLPGVRLSDARPCRPPITANTHVTFND